MPRLTSRSMPSPTADLALVANAEVRAALAAWQA